MKKNLLYYGDNLDVLREHIADESTDLIYLDPPFNSNRAYNVFFRSPNGIESAAQIHAFDDTWHWAPPVDQQFDWLIAGGAPPQVSNAMIAMRQLLNETDMMAYLVMMTPRLLELWRVLKSTGSLYLHCDPTASHYLKILLDSIFGAVNFRSEIIWRRTGSHNKAKRWAPIHDVILFYTKSEKYTWNNPRRPYMAGHVEEHFEKDEHGYKTAYYGNVLTGSGVRGGESGQPWGGVDPTAKGRHWAIPSSLFDDIDADVSTMTQHEKLDFLFENGFIKIVSGQYWPIYERRITPQDGPATSDLWAFQPYTKGTVFGSNDEIDADVAWLKPRDAERLGYPTQKPLGLLSRIIKASSNPGDIVLDPFCGCGTTVDAAQRLDRSWIGIDITFLAIDLIRKRLRHAHGDDIEKTYHVTGIPIDVEGAVALFEDNRFDFERWAVSLVDGEPNAKQVGDRGVDGRIRFHADKKNIGQVIVSVKGGQTINPTMMRDLIGTVNREKAEMGLLITMTKPTRGILEEASKAGSYTSPLTSQSYPKIQVLTIAELLAGEKPKMPPAILPYIKAAAKRAEQLRLT